MRGSGVRTAAYRGKKSLPLPLSEGGRGRGLHTYERRGFMATPHHPPPLTPARNGRGKALIPTLAGIMALLAATLPVLAVPVNWDLQINPPPIIADSTRPRACTIAWLVDDIATNDVFAVRMQITPAEDATPVGDRIPCPANVPPRLAARALDVCTARAGDPRRCVFADMGRGFEREPDVRNSAENAARCASDKFTHIGLACWKAGALEVCDVGCGRSAADAQAEARSRCAEKQQKICNIAGSLPILAP